MHPPMVVLDSRRRTSFKRIGRAQDTRYLVREFNDGTLVLTPATVITQSELAALTEPRLRETLTAPLEAMPAAPREPAPSN